MPATPCRQVFTLCRNAHQRLVSGLERQDDREAWFGKDKDGTCSVDVNTYHCCFFPREGGGGERGVAMVRQVVEGGGWGWQE